MNANELAEIIQHLENARYIGASKAAEMLRQQQAVIEDLNEENTDLRYLIATKLEQQDGISLNSMAHPITNTPEPRYEINPDKLETIEIDLPSPEPVAWIKQGKYGKPTIVQNPLYQFSYQAESVKQPDIPLYTHPVKELTDEEILGCWVEEFTGNALPSIDFARAILRKAQEK